MLFMVPRVNSKAYWTASKINKIPWPPSEKSWHGSLRKMTSKYNCNNEISNKISKSLGRFQRNHESWTITRNHQQILSVERDQEIQLISLAAFGGIMAWTVTQNDHKMSPVQRYLENQRIPLAAFGGILAWTVTQNDKQILLVERNLENLLIPWPPSAEYWHGPLRKMTKKCRRYNDT